MVELYAPIARDRFRIGPERANLSHFQTNVTRTPPAYQYFSNALATVSSHLPSLVAVLV